MIVIGALLYASVVAALLRGDLRRLKHVSLRLETLLPVGLVIQIVGPRLVSGAVPATFAWITGSALIVVTAWANRHLLGFRVIAIGVVINAVVILANGGMPVSVDALRYLGVQDVEGAVAMASALYGLAGEGTLLPFLGDVLPIPGPAFIRSLVSLGDILLMIGVVVVILEAASTDEGMPGSSTTR